MNFKLAYQKNPCFRNRYINPRDLHEYLEDKYAENLTELGRSYRGKPIYKQTWGSGGIKILAWSQMHGNESNSTHAMLDLLETLEQYPELAYGISENIQLDFVWMLNPDGAEKWTRRNALGIDLNRDFLRESSIEFPLLKSLAQKGGYRYAFNLHEQRTIFSTDGEHPATLSFLAPSADKERIVTETRKVSMAIIVDVYEKVRDILPNCLAKYSDEFYPTSTGDNFMRMGLPTILFEGGHYPDDYRRFFTRKYYTIALYYALKSVIDLNGTVKGWERYAEIPENKAIHQDVIYRNVKLNTNFECVIDIAVQYREEISEGDKEISFIPIVVEVGDCSEKKGWKEIDCTGKYFKSEFKFPKLDAPQNFEIV